jgi:hypothetical protein
MTLTCERSTDQREGAVRQVQRRVRLASATSTTPRDQDRCGDSRPKEAVRQERQVLPDCAEASEDGVKSVQQRYDREEKHVHCEIERAYRQSVATMGGTPLSHHPEGCEEPQAED